MPLLGSTPLLVPGLVLLLAVLALVLVKPGPAWVRRWGFLHAVPRPAMVLWQAGTVGALIATVGAGVVVAEQLWQHGADHPVLAAVLVLACLFALNVVVRLGWGIVVVTRQTSVRRARHRRSVDLLADVDETGVHVLAEAMPMAYCLPGVGRSRLVLSTGTLQRLARPELAAVLAHERAHLRARHDVVLDWFASVHRAFPHLVRSDVALQESRVLVEMLADDAARREVGSVPVARALVAMAGSPVPAEALGAADLAALQRIRRLGDDPGRPWLSAGVYLLASSLVVLPVLAVVIALVLG